MPFAEGQFTNPVSPACNTCKHFHKGMNPPSCSAFKKIPLKVLSGENDHRNYMPNDKGVRWEPEE